MESESSSYLKPGLAGESAWMPRVNGMCSCGVLSESGMKPDEVLSMLDAPTQIGWTVSRRCNFTCPHCFNNSGPDHQGYEPPRDMIIDNICDARPYNVCLCGGEPFTWDDLGYLTRRLRDGGINRVSIVTNGYLATRERLRQASDEGLNSLQLSIDGSCQEEMAHLRPATGSFERACRAAEAVLSTEGIEDFAVSWIPTRYNVDGLKTFVETMERIGVKDIRIQPLMATGRGAGTYNILRPTANQYVTLVAFIEEANRRVTQRGPQLHWGDPLEHIWFYTRTEALPIQLSIQTEGWYEMSPYIPVWFGDATKHSIKEFWKQSQREMWNIPLMLDYADQLVTMDGMKELVPRIYFEDEVRIDRFDEENWALARKTRDAHVLMDYARSRGLYSRGD